VLMPSPIAARDTINRAASGEVHRAILCKNKCGNMLQK
jgi:hypothetical protein